MSHSTKKRKGNRADAPAKKPSFEMPNPGAQVNPGVDILNSGLTEATAVFQEAVDKGVSQTQDSLKTAQDFLKTAKVAGQEATHLVQNTSTAAAKGAAEYNLKVIEIARLNANAAFDYFQKLLGVKSPSEFIELSSACTRKQFEAIAAQTKELTMLAQKVSLASAEPLKGGIAGAFNRVA